MKEGVLVNRSGVGIRFEGDSEGGEIVPIFNPFQDMLGALLYVFPGVYRHHIALIHYIPLVLVATETGY